MKRKFLFFFGFAASVLCFAVSYSAVASDTLISGARIVKAKAGVELELAFEGKYAARGLKPTYERNFVQFVLEGVGVKNAQMIPVGQGGLDKVFIYQYQPGVARVRFIMSPGVEPAKGRISLWNAKGTAIRFLMKPSLITASTKKATNIIDRVATAEAKPDAAEEASAAAVVKTSAAEEQALRDVLKGGEETTATAEAKTAAAEPVGIKQDPSRHFLRMILALLGVIGLFVGGVFVLRKYADRIDLKKLPFGKKERLIQVVASHRLGKSQAISLVKVTGEYMVMGVSGENISLIAKLGRDVDVEKYLEDRHWGGVLEKHLKDLEKPATEPKFAYDGVRDVAVATTRAATAATSSAPTPISGFRAALKEKITHLKPLS